MNESEHHHALAAADKIIAEHGYAHSGERYRLVLALAYLQGQHDGMTETKSMADAAFARLADDLRGVTP